MSTAESDSTSGDSGIKISNDEQKLYRNEETLKRLYWDEALTTCEVADRLNCSQYAVMTWMQKHGIERRSNSIQRATYFTDTRGYERWNANVSGTTETVGVHELTAIADGADPHKVFADDTHVHHRNGLSFDNRLQNVEAVTIEEHERIHREGQWTFDGALGCAVIDGGGADA